MRFDVCLTFLRTVQKIHISFSLSYFQSKTKWMTLVMMLIFFFYSSPLFCLCSHNKSIWIPLNPSPIIIFLMSDLSAAGIYSNSKRWHPLWLPLFVLWCPGQLHCSKQHYTRLFCALLVMSWSERHKAWVEQTHFLFSLFTSMSLHAYQLYLRDSWPRNKKDFSSHIFSILIQRRSLTYSISSTLLSCSKHSHIFMCQLFFY